MANTPPPRERASRALGEPVQDWIHRHRNSTARLTRGQLARILSEDYGITVSVEAIRQWEISADRQSDGDPEQVSA